MFGRKWRKFWSSLKKQPYVEIVSEGGRTAEGFPLELDWNDAFIDELARCGIEGETDEEMVLQWLQNLMRAQDIEEHQKNLMLEAEAIARENSQSEV